LLGFLFVAGFSTLGVGDELGDRPEIIRGNIGVPESVGRLVTDGGETKGAVMEETLHEAILVEAGIFDGGEINNID